MRILYSLVQILKTSIPLGLPAAIILIVQKEVFAGLLLLFFLVLITFVLLFVIQSFYLLVLRFIPAAKVQRAVTVIQVLFGILLFAMSQLASQLVDLENSPLLQSSHYPWLKYYPLYWYAIAIESMTTGNFTVSNILVIIACLLLPMITFIFLIRYLGGYYTGRLTLSTAADKQSATPRKRIRLAALAARLFTSDQQERAGFLFTWSTSSRLREYNLKIYPFFGYVLISICLPFISRLTRSGDSEEANIYSRPNLLWISIYLLSIMGFVIYGNLPYAEKFKAHWFWKTSPLDKPGVVIAGGFKAVFIKFNFIFLLAFFIAGIIKAEPGILLNQILATCNLLIVSALVMLIEGSQLPFSKKPLENSSVGCMKMLYTMLVFIGAGALGIIQYLVADKWWALILLTLISLAGAWWLIAEIKNTSWDNLKPGRRQVADELA